MRKDCLGAIACALLAAQSAALAATYQLDEFTVRVGVNTVFSDTFSDGVAPQTGVGGYGAVFGGFGPGAETAGRLNLDGNAGLPFGSFGKLQYAAPGAAVFGTSSFNVQGRFDFTAPAAGEIYFVRLDDIVSVSGGQRATSYSLAIRQVGVQTFASLTQVDPGLGSSTTLFTTGPLDGTGQSQIQLSFDGTGDGVVNARYQFVGGTGTLGALTTVGTFSAAPGHLAYRSAFGAFASPVPEPEAALLMLSGLGLVGVATRRRSRS